MSVYHSCPHCGNEEVGCGIDQCNDGHVYCDACSVYTDDDVLGTSCPVCEAAGTLIGEITLQQENEEE